jgi:hypothetical protein
MADVKKERAKEIADRLKDVVRDGESFLVTSEDGEVSVKESVSGGRVSPLRDSHPDLYGRLLAVSDGVSRAGGLLRRLVWLATAGLCVALVAGLLDDTFLGGAAEEGLHWVSVGVFLLAAAIVNGTLAGIFRGLFWAQARTAAHRDIGDAGFSGFAVLAMIEGDGAVAPAGARLKRDLARGADRW